MTTATAVCNCEHADHFDDDAYGNPSPRVAHEYCAIPAGRQTAQFVGPVCDACASDHLHDYLNTEASTS